jgi:hypothetical protein
VGIFEQAKGKRHNLATFAMAGRHAGLLVACLRCACFSQVHVCKLNQHCSGNVGTRGTYLRRLLSSRHPTDAGTYVQRVLRPWSRATKAQLAALSIPTGFLASPPSASARGVAASSSGAADVFPLASIIEPSGASGDATAPAASCAASSAVYGATGAGSGVVLPVAASCAACPAVCDAAGAGPVDELPAEEWDIDQLVDWFGDTGL